MNTMKNKDHAIVIPCKKIIILIIDGNNWKLFQKYISNKYNNKLYVKLFIIHTYQNDLFKQLHIRSNIKNRNITLRYVMKNNLTKQKNIDKLMKLISTYKFYCDKNKINSKFIEFDIVYFIGVI